MVLLPLESRPFSKNAKIEKIFDRKIDLTIRWFRVKQKQLKPPAMSKHKNALNLKTIFYIFMTFETVNVTTLRHKIGFTILRAQIQVIH